MISLRPATRILAFAALALPSILVQLPPAEAGPAVRQEDGKYFNKADEPTYNIKEDGTVDWYTYSGFRRYHSECHVCHGPDGEGSTYAPGLKDSLHELTYPKFLEIVAVGRERVTASETSKMPALGDNLNVVCYLDDIYVYLKARADGVLPRGRPAKREDKPESAKKAEEECLK